MDVKDVINEIADINQPLVNSHLADMAQLDPTGVPYFKETWKKIELTRRRQIISRLVELAADDAELNFDLVYKTCLNDTDAAVRKQAIEGLWEDEEPGLIRAFIRLMENDPSEEVQAAAASALGKFTLMTEIEELAQEYRDTLAGALLAVYNKKDKNIDIRRRALEAAAVMSLPEVKQAIRQAYVSNDERLKISAVFAMGKTCDNSWLPTVYTELKNPDAEMRYEAAGACGEIGEEDAIPYLLEIINDEDVEVRLAVIQGLAEIGGPVARKELQRIADDPNEAVRDAVEQALAQIQAMDDLTVFEMKSPGAVKDDFGEED